MLLSLHKFIYYLHIYYSVTETKISGEQKREFKRKGFLVLEDAIDSDLIADAQATVWESLTGQPTPAPEKLKGAGYFSLRELNDLDPYVQIRKSVFEAVESLVGDGVLEQPTDELDIPNNTQLAINCQPTDEGMNRVARRIRESHLDGYGRHFRNPEHENAGVYTYFTVGSGIYLNDIEDGGGGFTVFPGSHRLAAEYFETHSLESPGWTGTLPAMDESGDGWDYAHTLDEQLLPYEISGSAGTVILFHNKLLHGNGVNHRPTPRIGMFTRYIHREGRSIKRDAADKLWKYMGDLSDVEVDLEANPVSYGDYFGR